MALGGLLWTPLLSAESRAAKADSPADFIRSNYTKSELMIPMRDGVKLFTAVYAPKDSSRHYPILMERTPYSVAPVRRR